MIESRGDPLDPPFFLGEENPFFSIKRVFTPRAPRFPKITTKGLVALWTLTRVVDDKKCSFRAKIESRMALKSIPCLK